MKHLTGSIKVLALHGDTLCLIVPVSEVQDGEILADANRGELVSLLMRSETRRLAKIFLLFRHPYGSL